MGSHDSIVFVVGAWGTIPWRAMAIIGESIPIPDGLMRGSSS